MKRSIPRAVLNPMRKPPEKSQAEEINTDQDSQRQSDDAKANLTATSTATSGSHKSSGGVGSAWKRGAMSQMEDDLTALREAKADDILSGQQVFALDVAQISDEIGSDRRPDWSKQESFQQLVESIKRNGQDVPIQVYPIDLEWKPDLRDGNPFAGIKFSLISGRRRTEACRALGIKVRAVIKQPSAAPSTAEQKFELLLLRFRENEEREDLSPFERLLSIGEMYEELATQSQGKKLTAVAFAERIGIHESLVSRARAVFRHHEEILNAFKNVYEFSFRELQEVLSSLGEDKKTTAAKKKEPKSNSAKDNVISHANHKIGQITWRKKDLLIAIDAKDNKAFGEYLVEQIPEIYSRFKQSSDNE